MYEEGSEDGFATLAEDGTVILWKMSEQSKREGMVRLFC